MNIKVVRKITTVKTYSALVEYDPANRDAYSLDEDLPFTAVEDVNDTTEFFDSHDNPVDLIRLEEIYHGEL